MEFNYDGGGPGKGALIPLYIDSEKTGENPIERSTPNIFSLDDKTDVGSDRCIPVSDDYDSADSEFVILTFSLTIAALRKPFSL